jgi:amino acid transporter
MGEIPAIAAGACLTLEYVIASSAVARSWGDKVVSLIVTFYMDDDVDAETNTLLKILEPGYNLNPMAFLISIGAVTLLLRGVKESKRATLFFTALKVTLIAFMCIVSLSLFKKENLVPMLPSQFGVQGILRGSTSSFFGYIGFDEICCMGGEVVNPTKNLPRAVMGTIGLVTIMYVLAAIGLVGMVPYEYISPTSGFPEGFQYRGYDAIAQITALGEIITLSIVVLVTTMAQPRLQYAMAIDGLLPQIFAKVDATGNLWFGTLFAGTIMITVATCVPFTFLNDLISAGVLMAFSMTAASVILLRQQSPKGQPFMLEKLLIKFNILSLSMGLLIHLADFDMTGQLLTFLNFLMLIGLAIKIGTKCPLIASNNGGVVYFQTPLVPYLPLFAQFMNWYLMGQLGPYSVLLLLGYVTMAVVPYLLFGQGKSLSKDQDEQQGELTNSDSDSSSSQISLSPMTEEIIFI